LSQRLGHPVVIENRPGASSTLAAQAVVNSPPDGYTLLLLGGSALMATLITSVPFDLQRDLAPVSGLVDYPMVLVAHPSVPAKTVAELIVLAKAKPGTISMGSFGTGSASHLACELFKMMAGVNLLHVPYRGGAPMVTDLIGGQVQLMFDTVVGSIEHIRGGRCWL
jgi:tripartite-type tricarboxylate transporter receptor subunit TctC